VGVLTELSARSSVGLSVCLSVQWVYCGKMADQFWMPFGWWMESVRDECRPITWIHTHTHTTVLLLFWNISRTTRVSRYQKGKTRKVETNQDLLEQEIVNGSGICWAICNAYSLRPPARSPPAWRHMGSPHPHKWDILSHFLQFKTTSGFIFLLLVVWSDLATNRKPVGLVSKAMPAHL